MTLSSDALNPAVKTFAAPYAPEDEPIIRRFIAETALAPESEARIDRQARRLIEEIRAKSGAFGGLEDFLREYGLSTREGLALMVLAEALLRVPDAATQDRLIEDKLKGADWAHHAGRGDTWFVSASTWALGMSARIVQPGETPDNILAGLVKRLGAPAVRTGTRQAMRVLGHHFVLGETIDEALRRARSLGERGFRHSFDMLGEGARTAADAVHYFDAYAEAITAIGRAAGDKPLPDRPGISVKLSALHPRYEPLQGERVRRELCPRLLDLCRAAKGHDLNLTVDAEEADRLELSLGVVAAVAADPSLAGWDGFGLAVQAYQKRAVAVVEWAAGLAGALGRRFMVRLVKGAYWDTEVKRAQERGLADYPVFTRKPSTDVSYLAAARRLLSARPRLYPQFATHNALTAATLLEMADGADGYEFQRLHGMGEDLYDALRADSPTVACRIYAPVGGHRDLLAYLVRRLLENGANSSFVALTGDKSVPVDELLIRPASLLDGGRRARHPRIVLPRDLYAPSRKNSGGLEFGDAKAREALLRGLAAAETWTDAAPLLEAKPGIGLVREMISPVDGTTRVGTVADIKERGLDEAVGTALSGFGAWSRTPVEQRAATLERLADLLESSRETLMALMAKEGGKTLPDSLSEVREAVDFCRYYAAEARGLFAAGTVMPGPTGERDVLAYRGRGVFICISPWNFPLSIFLGQVAAALVAGNAVIAKPAEQTPLLAFRIAELLYRAGVPRDAFQLAPGDGGVGAALVSNPRIAGVIFTGSTETAWKINRALAAKDGPIVPLIAETGGLNAMIVDATALPEQVTDDVVASAFRSAGQRCSALRLMFVQADVADRVLGMIEGAAAELALGDPGKADTDIGPVIDADARRMLEAHILECAAAPWAKVRFAGKIPSGCLSGGSFFPPHIIELDDASRLSREVFGPILHVVRYRAGGLDRVIDQIAATGYALTLGIHSRIDQTVDRVVDRLAIGNVYINRAMIGAVVGTQPFGGSGLSGTGPKAGGADYLRRLVLEQSVSVNTAAVGGNASLIALGDE